MGGLAQNVQKTPPGKNVQKSQGQISQGQMGKNRFKPEKPEKLEKMCRKPHQEKMCKNPKVKYFRNFRKVRNVRNFRNVWNVWNVKTKNGEIQNENKMGKRKKKEI